MKFQTDSSLRRIELLSRFVRGCCSALLVVLPVTTVVASVGAAAGHLTALHFAAPSFSVPDLSAQARGWVAAAVLVSGVILTKALYHLRALADRGCRSEFFTATFNRQLCDLGVTWLLWGGVQVVWSVLLAAVSTRPGPSFPVAIEPFLIGIGVIVIGRLAHLAVDRREGRSVTI